MADAAKVKQASEWLKSIIWLTYNLSYEDFTELLKKMTRNPSLREEYVEGHWEKMRNDAANWLMGVDRTAREVFINAALDKYGE